MNRNNILTSIAAFTLVTPLLAQPVIELSDVPTESVPLELHLVTSSGSSDPAITGADVTWDFSTATLTLVGAATLAPASATPFAAQYPDANWALHLDPFVGEEYIYFRSTETMLEAVADGIPDDPSAYSNYTQLLQFPFSYGQNFTDDYQREGAAPDQVTWYYSGYGTVISSIGTFENVIQTYSNEGDWVFWLDEPLHPFIIIEDNAIYVLAPASTGVAEHAGTTASVHPNPVKDVLRINGHQAGDRYELLDAIGRQVLSGAFTTSDATTLATDMLAPGTYRLRIWNNNNAQVIPVVKN